MIGSSLSWRMEDADGPSELVPDQILPVQFAELLQRSAERTPELRLMAAVLEDAIRTFCRCSGSRGVRRRRLLRENICDALALEPGWVRRLLRRWQASQTPRAHGPAAWTGNEAVRRTKHLDDVLAHGVIECLGMWRRCPRRLNRPFERRQLQAAAVRQDHRPVEDVLKLADVPGPGMAHQRFHHIGRNRVDAPAELPGVMHHEVAGE